MLMENIVCQLYLGLYRDRGTDAFNQTESMSAGVSNKQSKQSRGYISQSMFTRSGSGDV